MKKKLIFAFMAVTMLAATAEAKRWKKTATVRGPGGCVEQHYVCSTGFGFSGCEIGSTQVVITCPPCDGGYSN